MIDDFNFGPSQKRRKENLKLVQKNNALLPKNNTLLPKKRGWNLPSEGAKVDAQSLLLKKALSATTEKVRINQASVVSEKNDWIIEVDGTKAYLKNRKSKMDTFLYLSSPDVPVYLQKMLPSYDLLVLGDFLASKAKMKADANS